ncbi:hypothetical protein [Streptomyces sp. NPDC059224]
MDEPCSALDPASTRRIEETVHEPTDEVTVVIVEHGPTDQMFHTP